MQQYYWLHSCCVQKILRWSHLHWQYAKFLLHLMCLARCIVGFIATLCRLIRLVGAVLGLSD